MSEPKPTRFYRRRGFLVAAGVFLVMLAGVGYWYAQQVREDKELEAMLKRLEAAGAVVGRGVSISSTPTKPEQLLFFWDSLNGKDANSVEAIELPAETNFNPSEEDMRLIGKLPWLVSLRLPVVPPGSLHYLKNSRLVDLHLGPSRLNEEDWKALSGMRVYYLRLAGDSVGERELDRVLTMRRLVELYISDAPIGDNAAERLAKADRLECLGLLRTGLTEAGLVKLKGMNNLYALNVSGARVTDAGLEHLAGLQKLQGLDLSHTAVTDEGLERILKLKGLGVLGLGGTKITDVGLERLLKLPTLYSVDISQTRVTDEGMEHLAKLPWLQSLMLNETEIGDAGLERLSKLSTLYELDLSHTRVTDAGVEHLKKMKLNTLWIEGTSVSDEKLEELKAVNPSLNIIRKKR